MPAIPQTAPYPVFQGNDVIEFVKREVPEPQSGQLLVACKANALCASDLGQYHGGSAIAPGHEAAGIVVSVGQNTSVPVGTPGVIFLMDFCGTCRNCKLGVTNQCKSKRADYGFSCDGGYGPYALVNENVFLPVDNDLPLDEATLLLDVMGTGGHAVFRANNAHLDPQSLLITGSGPIGLGVLAMAKLILGHDFPVLITDMVPFRLDIAESLGGLPVNISENSLSDGLDDHGYQTVDLAIDSSGVTSARRAALDKLDQRGVQVCVGHGGALPLEVSPDLISTERTILGSEYFRFDELAANLELLTNNREFLGRIITHRYPIEELNQAYETFIGKDSGKVIAVQ
jgi:threonine 3-dehydrogenase